MDDGRKSAGNFRERISNIHDITINDFSNPWNFYTVFMADTELIREWCIANGLLPSLIKCPTAQCEGLMELKKRGGRVGDKTFRCDKNRNHERSSRIYSFFENSMLTISDIMMFLKSYLDGNSLLQCSKFAGIAYRSTAVHWASYIRELFKEYFQIHIKTKILTGEIEIDESLFGRKIKYNKGNPNLGLRIWIFGLVDRGTNTVILYPVSDRSKETLLPIIQRHVEPGSTIYSDGWSAYCSLNELGYKHFTVLHKHSFKKTYKNVETGELVDVHTNRIEGAWKHAKQHFKKMSGTKVSQFEGHLAEIMWRSDAKGNLYNRFFTLLSSVYNLERPPTYLYSTPLFDTWDIQSSGVSTPMAEWNIEPIATDAESGIDSENEVANDPQNSAILIQSSDESQLPPNKIAPETKVFSKSSTSQLLHELFSESEEDTIVETPPNTVHSVSTKSDSNPKFTKSTTQTRSSKSTLSNTSSSAKRKSLERPSTSGKKKISN